MNTFGGFHNGFRNGRVSMHNAAELIGGGFEGHADAGFGEELGRVCSDDVDSEDFVVFLLADDLDEPVSLAQDACFA